MKLIKIKENHFIIVSDESIKEGDNILDNVNRIWLNIESCFLKPMLEAINSNNVEYMPKGKITHSTEPLEGVLPLDLSEVKELIGKIDAELLYPKLDVTTEEDTINIYKREGFNKCLELNKEKKYTETDILNAIKYGIDTSKDHISINDRKEKFINSLQPPTEWNITINNGKIELV